MEYFSEYENNLMRTLGFDPDKLTEDQKYILTEPFCAPENYYHDGEVTHAQAKQIWRNAMKKAGFTALEIFKVEQKMQ
jgi:hypothetical protein